ncbi:MAG TPA: hypothetical protein VF740_05315, partial [Candidatus Acidoferrum sp.]
RKIPAAGPLLSVDTVIARVRTLPATAGETARPAPADGAVEAAVVVGAAVASVALAAAVVSAAAASDDRDND